MSAEAPKNAGEHARRMLAFTRADAEDASSPRTQLLALAREIMREQGGGQLAAMNEACRRRPDLRRAVFGGE